MVAAGWPLFGAVDRGHEWPLLAYSVEKLQIRAGAILLRRERTKVNPGLTCIQADVRTPSEASSAS